MMMDVVVVSLVVVLVTTWFLFFTVLQVGKRFHQPTTGTDEYYSEMLFANCKDLCSNTLYYFFSYRVLRVRSTRYQRIHLLTLASCKNMCVSGVLGTGTIFGHESTVRYDICT